MDVAQVEKAPSEKDSSEESDGSPSNPPKWWRRHGSPSRSYKAWWPKRSFESHFKPDVFNEDMVMNELQREMALASLEDIDWQKVIEVRQLSDWDVCHGADQWAVPPHDGFNNAH